MKPIDKVLERLSGVRAVQNGYVACCPAHDDKKPSLSITEGEDGRVLAHCHAGCTFEQVVKAAGLEQRDFHCNRVNDNVKGNYSGDNSNFVDKLQAFESADDAIAFLARSRGHPSAKYPYPDSQGNIIAYQLRWDHPYGHKQFMPISLRSGKWVIKGPPAPRPPYSLTKLFSAEDIYLVEGEKAVGKMQACGFTASTSMNGARGAAKTDWSILAGKRVVIWPDNDPSGEQYCENLIQQLARLHPAPTIKVFRPGGLPEKGDIVEFIELYGGDLDASRQAILDGVEVADVVELPKEEPPACVYRPFPIEHLPATIRSYVRIASAAIGCDPAFLALPLLPLCGSMLGNRFRAKVKDGWLEPPVIWAAIVGESGTMKTPALNTVLEPLYELQTSLNSDYQKARRDFDIEHANYLRVYANHKKTGDGTPPECPAEPTLQQLIVSDATIEALAVILMRNPNGVLLLRDELGGWISSFDRYSQGKGGGDVSHWLSTFGAGPLLMDRKTGPTPQVYVPHAAVCVTGGIQPGTLSRVLGQQHRDNGLLARFLVASPPRKHIRWRDEGITPRDQANLAKLINDLLEFVPDGCVAGHGPYEIPFDPDAKARWCEFFNHHEHEQIALTGDHAAAWSKLKGYVPRLALIFWAIRRVTGGLSPQNAGAIDLESISSAIRIIEWFKHETHRIYSLLDESETDQARRRLIEFIQAKDGQITASELTRSFRPYRAPGMAKEALEQLVADGYGHWEQPPQQGRGRPPAKVFVLVDLNANGAK